MSGDHVCLCARVHMLVSMPTPFSTAAQVVEALYDAADPIEEAKIRNRVADEERAP